jgi:hypothetical protein
MVNPTHMEKDVALESLEHGLGVATLFRGWLPEQLLERRSVGRATGVLISQRGGVLDQQIDDPVPERAHRLGREFERPVSQRSR